MKLIDKGVFHWLCCHLLLLFMNDFKSPSFNLLAIEAELCCL